LSKSNGSICCSEAEGTLTSHNRDYGGITKLIDRAHLMRARLERSVSVCAMGSTSPSAAGHLAQSSAETRRAASTAAPHRHGYSSHRNPDQTVDDLVDIERRAYATSPPHCSTVPDISQTARAEAILGTRYQLPDTVLMRNCTSKRFLTKRQQRCHP